MECEILNLLRTARGVNRIVTVSPSTHTHNHTSAPTKNKRVIRSMRFDNSNRFVTRTRCRGTQIRTQTHQHHWCTVHNTKKKKDTNQPDLEMLFDCGVLGFLFHFFFKFQMAALFGYKTSAFIYLLFLFEDSAVLFVLNFKNSLSFENGTVHA